uniref:Secreted protein n=1 Tax=Glossina pallidipes TaxID=7398 RepID=A0A1A9ZYQ0_GLOPL
MMKNLMVLTTLARCIPAATDDGAGIEDGEEVENPKLITVVLRFRDMRHERKRIDSLTLNERDMDANDSPRRKRSSVSIFTLSAFPVIDVVDMVLLAGFVDQDDVVDLETDDDDVVDA